MPEPTDANDAAVKIVKQIYASTLIPESHKDKYVDYILANGFTDKMLDELDKIFAEEAKGLRTEIADQKELLTTIDQMVAEDRAANDQTQATILFTFDKAMKEDVQNFKKDLENVNVEMESKVEDAGKEEEKSEIDAIRAKLMGG